MSRLPILLLVCSMGLVAHAQSPAPSRAPAPKPAPAPAPAGKPAPAPPQAAPPPAQSAPAPAPAPASSAPLTDEQKTIYALGLLMQRSLREFDLSPDEIEVLKRALLDGAAGTPAIELSEWGPTIEAFGNARGVRAMAREKAAAAAYLETAAAEIGAVRTPSGLVYREIAAGVGLSPTATDTVRVHYRGTLINGTVFDSTHERNEPASFRLGGVIPCWTEGVQRMKIGGKARLVCPSDLAYGDAGNQAIPGGSALIFEVELLGIGAVPGAAR